jgi:4Fe-4S ferredoxin
MPLKKRKRDTVDSQTLEWILHTQNFKLMLDKKVCVGCEICSLACPKEAIKLEKQPKNPQGKALKAKIDIDLEKCNFCGICDIMCPYGAIIKTVNGEHILSVVEKDSFPLLIRDIQVDTSKCKLDCVDCEEACPLDLIKVTKISADGSVVKNVDSLPKKEREKVKVKVDVEKERCPCCRICEFKCPEGAISVKKNFSGKILINTEKCPENCTDCIDVCPIEGTLYLSDEDKKVQVKEVFCVYCGACKVVCPVDDALELERTKINHTPITSGAWNKALERIASTLGITKELQAKGAQKMVETVEKRLKKS